MQLNYEAAQNATSNSSIDGATGQTPYTVYADLNKYNYRDSRNRKKGQTKKREGLPKMKALSGANTIKWRIILKDKT